MSWHYSNDGKQVGPISEAEFEASVKSGVIHGDTLVWREGFPQWTSYSEVSQAAGGNVATATAAWCAECGKEFSQDEMVNFGGAWVCAACKPQYVQKIKEGVNVGGTLVYAGFWIRFCAKFLDGILLQLMGFVLGAIAGVLGAIGGAHQAQVATLIASLLSFALQIAYNVFFIGKYGATLGKMAAKIKVVRSNGEPVSYARALGRYFAEMLNAFTLLIGYIIAAWDPEKRALHDRICDTRVIKG